MNNRPSDFDSNFKQFLDEFKSTQKIEFAANLTRTKLASEVAKDDERREEQLDKMNKTLEKILRALGGSKNISTNSFDGGEKETGLKDQLKDFISGIKKFGSGVASIAKSPIQSARIGVKKAARVNEKIVAGFEDMLGSSTTTTDSKITSNETPYKSSEKLVSAKETIEKTKPASINPEADNVETPDEKIADAAEKNVQIQTQILDTVKSSLTQLIAIKESLTKPQREETTKAKQEPTILDQSGTPFAPSIDLDSRRGKTIKSTPKRVQPTMGNAVPDRSVKPSTGSNVTTDRSVKPSTGSNVTTDIDIDKSTKPSTTVGKVEPDKATKPSIGSRAAGAIKGVGSKVVGAARVLGPIGAIAGAAYGAYEGTQRAGEIFGVKEGKEATTGQKVSAAVGGITDPFGLGYGDTVAKGVHSAGKAISEGASSVGKKISGFFGFGGDNKKEETSAPKASSAPSEKLEKTKFSKEYLEKVAEGNHPRPLISQEKAKELLKNYDERVSSTTDSTKRETKSEFSKEYLEKVIQGEHPRPLISKEKAKELLNSSSIESNNKKTNASDVRSGIEENILLRDEVSKQSNQVQPVVSNNVSTNNNTTYVPMKADPRPSHRGSAFENYLSRTSVY